jgi:hypothetical protein
MGRPVARCASCLVSLAHLQRIPISHLNIQSLTPNICTKSEGNFLLHVPELSDYNESLQNAAADDIIMHSGGLEQKVPAHY